MLNIGITMGDPAGIGPEVILKALAETKIRKLAKFIIIGNSYALARTARICKIKFKTEKNIEILEIGSLSKLTFGKPVCAYGSLTLDYLNVALTLIKSKKIDALVTAPVNKYTINRALIQGASDSENKCIFTGHTEYLAEATNSKNFAMMLVGGPFKVVLATRHIALKDVPGALTPEKIYQAIRLTAFALRKYFAILHPNIAVCSLNPHAADKGIMGTEERKVIQPAVAKARGLASIKGPLPADTVFYLALHGKFDAVVAMYHDQGLISLKTFALHQGVNLTLGLPFVRTSVDHGTAYDIAGKNRANPGSMMEAIKIAVKIAKRQK